MTRCVERAFARLSCGFAGAATRPGRGAATAPSPGFFAAALDVLAGARHGVAARQRDERDGGKQGRPDTVVHDWLLVVEWVAATCRSASRRPSRAGPEHRPIRRQGHGCRSSCCLPRIGKKAHACRLPCRRSACAPTPQQAACPTLAEDPRSGDGYRAPAFTAVWAQPTDRTPRARWSRQWRRVARPRA